MAPRRRRHNVRNCACVVPSLLPLITLAHIPAPAVTLPLSHVHLATTPAHHFTSTQAHKHTQTVMSVHTCVLAHWLILTHLTASPATLTTMHVLVTLEYTPWHHGPCQFTPKCRGNDTMHVLCCGPCLLVLSWAILHTGACKPRPGPGPPTGPGLGFCEAQAPSSQANPSLSIMPT